MDEGKRRGVRGKEKEEPGALPAEKKSEEREGKETEVE